MSPCCWDNISSFKGTKIILNLIQIIIIIIIATKTKKGQQGHLVVQITLVWLGTNILRVKAGGFSLKIQFLEVS